MNPLIFSPSPRDIPQWLEAMKKITTVDKLFVKYFTPEKKAYDLARNYFLANFEYSHLVIIPDDLIVTPEQFKSLIDSVEEFDYPVFSGVANMDNTVNKDVFSLSYDLIHIERDKRRFSLITRQEIDYEAKLGRHIKVMWSGFPCIFIRRDVVEKFEFNLDGIANNDPDGFSGCCIDTVFCFYCYMCDIPIYVDPSVQMLHLKINDSIKEHFHAGDDNYPPKVYLEKSITSQIESSNLD